MKNSCRHALQAVEFFSGLTGQGLIGEFVNGLSMRDGLLERSRLESVLLVDQVLSRFNS